MICTWHACDLYLAYLRYVPGILAIFAYDILAKRVSLGRALVFISLHTYDFSNHTCDVNRKYAKIASMQKIASELQDKAKKARAAAAAAAATPAVGPAGSDDDATEVAAAAATGATEEPKDPDDDDDILDLIQLNAEEQKKRKNEGRPRQEKGGCGRKEKG